MTAERVAMSLAAQRATSAPLRSRWRMSRALVDLLAQIQTRQNHPSPKCWAAFEITGTAN
jgi:hypothetical protein